MIAKYVLLIFGIVAVAESRLGLFEVTPTSKEQLDELLELGRKLHWNFMKHPLVDKPARFTTSSDADNIKYIKSHLQELSLPLKIVNENMDELINKEIKDNALQRAKTQFRASGDGGIETYFAPHQEYNNWLKSLKDKYPNLVTVRTIGKSFKGRDTNVLKLSTGGNKPAMFLDGGIHAREWLSVSSVVYILNKLINDFNKGDPTAKSVLDKFDVYVLPVTNPDGYEFTREGGNSRLWRKNLMPVDGGCVGIDLNRNFDASFGTVGVSWDPCSITFPGKKAFSAPETVNFRDFVLSIKDKLKLFISFHAYSQLLLTPWAYTKTLPSDNDEMMRVANLMTDAIFKTSGFRYKAGSPAHILYEAAGGCYDWVKKVAGVKYSYTFEVRPDPSDSRGFVAPISWIKPAGEELYAGVVTAAIQARV